MSGGKAAAMPLLLGALGAGAGYVAAGTAGAAAAGAALGAVVGAVAAGGGGKDGPPTAGGLTLARPAGGSIGKVPGKLAPSPTFISDPTTAKLHNSGWARVQVPGIGLCEVTRLPAVDAGGELFARFSYVDALRWAARHGARLLTREVVQAVWEQGFALEPCPLVFTPYDQLHMRERNYCVAHDACVMAQLRGEKPSQRGKVRWDGELPVANCGKDKLEGALATWNLNGGWIRADGEWIQKGLPGQKTHGDDHTDYSELTRLFRRVGEA